MKTQGEKAMKLNSVDRMNELLDGGWNSDVTAAAILIAEAIQTLAKAVLATNIRED